MIDISIKYEQWISTDRSNLQEHEYEFDDFLDELSSQNFLVKVSPKFNEAVLVLDFAENFSLAVQDCA